MPNCIRVIAPTTILKKLARDFAFKDQEAIYRLIGKLVHGEDLIERSLFMETLMLS